MTEERKTLIKWLKDEVPKYFIISVWGMGSLGKTTLVNNVCRSQEIKKHFEHQVLVSVSQSFQVIDLLRRILKGLLGKERAHEVESFNSAGLVEKVRNFLQEKRCLVVLDDVWRPDAFFSLQDAFGDLKLGSKIVITTRIHEVASLADEQCRMELHKLSWNESWDLFCKKAFWKETQIENLPKGMSRLKNFCHLLTSRTNNNELWGFGRLSSIRAPKGLWRLTSLQELEIAVDDELVGRLRNLTQLKELFISKVRGIHCPQLCAALSQMPSLKRLVIVAYNEEEELQLQELGPVLKNVEKFHLYGRLVGRDTELDVLTGCLRDKIRHLVLGWTGLKEDPLRALSCLSNLASLTVVHAYDGKQLCFGAGWLPKLKVLELLNLPHLENVKMEKGSLESLRVLRLACLSSLKQVPQGIEFQASLEELFLREGNPVLVQKIKGEQKRNVDHIPTIKHRVLIDGSWNLEFLK